MSNEHTLSAAQDLTMQAWGELSACGHRAYIDCNKTTSYTLFLVDDQGTQHTLTIAQLLKLLPAANEQP